MNENENEDVEPNEWVVLSGGAATAAASTLLQLLHFCATDRQGIEYVKLQQ